MESSELRQLIEDSVEFPVTHDRLIEQVGEVELTAPTGDSVRISEVLNHSDEPDYRSSKMLHTTIVGNLDETFIGRKFYDDRGGNHTLPDPRRTTQRDP